MDIKDLHKQIKKLPPDKRAEALEVLVELEETKNIQASKTSFLTYVKRIWPGFIEGPHHRIMADAFDRVEKGECKRLIINMPPRHTKSEFGSYLLPSWFLGNHPEKQIIQASHTGELAVGFGRKVRNLMQTEDYEEIFEGVGISSDSKAAGRWNTNKKGSYHALGVGAAMAGKGADILIIDDPHDEQDAAYGQFNPEVYNRVYDWFTTGPRQRLQPNGAIILIQTRWSKIDLTGRLLQAAEANPKADQWEVIELPAILPSGDPLYPQFWSKKELELLRESIPTPKWQAQYQQNPTSEEGAIIKREWWQRWEKKRPPVVDAIIQSWDTAFTKTARSDPSACTTWGIFMHPDDNGVEQPNLILLDAMKEKMEFPELKRTAQGLYNEWEPDQLVVEKKASGGPLMYELRAMGIPVTEFTPSRGNDKIARINAISDLFQSGFVWAPDTKWAEEVIEECAAFPFGEHDDYVDSTTQALIRFRQGGWIRTSLDEPEEEYVPPPVVEYY